MGAGPGLRALIVAPGAAGAAGAGSGAHLGTQLGRAIASWGGVGAHEHVNTWDCNIPAPFLCAIAGDIKRSVTQFKLMLII